MNSSWANEHSAPPISKARRRILVVSGLVLAGGVIFGAAKVLSQKGPVKSHVPEPRIVSVSLPPAPPPPPPPPPQIKEEKMIEEENPTDAPPDEPATEAPAVTTNNVGAGAPDGFNLKGGRSGTGSIGGGKPRSKFGSYAGGVVQPKIAQALREHSRTRTASLNLQARIWVDATGRITRATISGTTGDSALDQTLRNEVLTGIQLSQPPPAGMPMPIVMRLSGRRPTS